MDANNALILAELPSLRRYARALTRDADLADDLVQDCLERALSRWALWRRREHLRPWLFAIMHNLHANAVRRRARARGIFADGLGDAEMPVPSTQIDGLALRDLAAALEQLPDDQHQTVLLVGLEGFTYAEVASITGVPIGTVMSRLSRGRERLRLLLAGDGTPAIRRLK
jgi:RNA polymerase sigma-70 factor (ECF subfamily)